MTHRVWFVGIFTLVAGCDLVAPDDSSRVGGSWGGPGGSLTVSHDTTYWRRECILGMLPLSIRLSSDGSFLASGTVTGPAFHGQPMRLYGTVQADSMQLYFQIQGVDGSWAPPGASLLIRGQATSNPDGIICVN